MNIFSATNLTFIFFTQFKNEKKSIFLYKQIKTFSSETEYCGTGGI